MRPYSHSLSDDERLYKSEEVRQEEAKRDPVAAFAEVPLSQERLVTEKELKELETRVEKGIRAAADQALAAEPPSPESVMLYIYSPTVDPCSERFDQPAQVPRRAQDDGGPDQCLPARRDGP